MTQATEPCDLSATEARRLIGLKQLSPVELLDSNLRRIEAVNPAVNAVVAMDVPAARAAAQAAEAAVMRGEVLGALHGLPVGVKDLEETAGLRTTFGSPLFKDNVPAKDERSVASIRAAGGIIFAKTNTPEFGAGANTRNAVYGATGNPFDPLRSAAGSSGGSAVALACGMAALCTGSDMGGSLRNPAAFNGIVGMRPSPEMMPVEKQLHGWSPLSVHGPMARNVADLALLFSAMTGIDQRAPLSRPVAAAPGEFSPPPGLDLSRLRVAITPDFGFALVEQRIKDVFFDRVERLRPHVAKLEIAAPDCTGTDEAFAVLRGLAFVASHSARAAKTPDLVSPNIHANLEEARGYGIAELAAALSAQTAIYRRWQAFYEQYDLLLAPAMAISPQPWSQLYPKEIDGQAMKSYYQWLAPAYAVSLVGHPALSLPVGLDSDGMPFGLQIVGPRHGDTRVIAAAAVLEQVFAADALTRRPLPDLAALQARAPLSETPGFYGYG
ncbi:MAG TPA: amidase family protein [Acidocella sp.]|jgi:Asp-tRNA(Asn)/Glu-tRNA(Gln) amidotransferase A subunit family amidase|uniref:amidase n=1 Tax=Acidocella sp. TaxID=50710 RepID=UPI002CFC8DDC|nr:amidase family protein [Acidocella sp.]HVE22633.1 amidase family protein [Acidocella sp.]